MHDAERPALVRGLHVVCVGHNQGEATAALALGVTGAVAFDPPVACVRRGGVAGGRTGGRSGAPLDNTLRVLFFVASNEKWQEQRRGYARSLERDRAGHHPSFCVGTRTRSRVPCTPPTNVLRSGNKHDGAKNSGAVL